MPSFLPRNFSLFCSRNITWNLSIVQSTVTPKTRNLSSFNPTVKTQKTLGLSASKIAKSSSFSSSRRAFFFSGFYNVHGIRSSQSAITTNLCLRERILCPCDCCSYCDHYTRHHCCIDWSPLHWKEDHGSLPIWFWRLDWKALLFMDKWKHWDSRDKSQWPRSLCFNPNSRRKQSTNKAIWGIPSGPTSNCWFLKMGLLQFLISLQEIWYGAVQLLFFSDMMILLFLRFFFYFTIISHIRMMIMKILQIIWFFFVIYSLLFVSFLNCHRHLSWGVLSSCGFVSFHHHIICQC